jgi:hypothetical protein
MTKETTGLVPTGGDVSFCRAASADSGQLASIRESTWYQRSTSF